MGDVYKVMSVERNGVDLPYEEEVLLSATNTTFDPTDGFSSVNVQDAVIEARDTASGKVRYSLFCGFDGTAGANRWLEWSKSVPSNSSPFIVIVPSTLQDISFSTSNTVTGSIGWYKNGSLIYTASVVSQSSFYVANLNLSLLPGDEISIKVISGSFGKPATFTFFQVA